MEKIRTPLQGLKNIVRFNWHFYVIAYFLVIVLLSSKWMLPPHFDLLAILMASLIGILVFISLAVSIYIYDLSGFYNFNWLSEKINSTENLITVNAGFDEISQVLEEKFKLSILQKFDFYDPTVHTEVSIKRARKIYPPVPGTQNITSNYIPLEDHSVDKAFVIFSAHEVRDFKEKLLLFKELRRVTKENGVVILTEQLRDIPNFLAYNIGFFHFLPRKNWEKTFLKSGFSIKKEYKITPFVTTFILSKDGNTY